MKETVSLSLVKHCILRSNRSSAAVLRNLSEFSTKSTSLLIRRLTSDRRLGSKGGKAGSINRGARGRQGTVARFAFVKREPTKGTKLNSL